MTDFSISPITTPEDRRKLKVCWTALGVIVFFIAGLGLARASQDDLGEKNYSNGYQAYAGHIGGSNKMVARRPAGCPSQWCGCFASIVVTGKNDRTLWPARNWPRDKRFRRVSGPAPGVIAVYARGAKGGHVGIVVSVVGPRTVLLLSGNDGGAVRERERSTAGIIAYLQYVGA